MSKLTELLDELCPDGVEYRPLGELCSKTSRFKWENLLGNAKYVDLTSVDIPTRRIRATTEVDESTAPSRAQQEIRVGDVLFGTTRPTQMRICIVPEAYDRQVASTGYCVLRADQDVVLPSWLFYALQTGRFAVFLENNQSTGSYPAISDKKLKQYQIPVPPLEVQQEIVRVLDAFTDLEQSLVSELELRKKQLNDYRHAHFANIKETDGCAVTLGEIAEVRSGWGFPKAYQGTLSGDLPFFKVGDMNLPGNETFLHSANNYISDTQAQELKVKPAPTGSIVFPKVGAAIATNKKRILTQESAFDNNVMSLVPGQKVDSDFLFHWIQTEDLVRWGNSSGGVPSIRKSDVEKVTLILPPREQQEVVASRLNVFSNLIQSIEQEISLRRQQYEFYRDELLSFAPKED